MHRLAAKRAPGIPRHDVEPAVAPPRELGPARAHERDAALAGTARVEPHRADALVGLGRRVADDGQLDLLARRVGPIQWHGDLGALETGIAGGPVDPGLGCGAGGRGDRRRGGGRSPRWWQATADGRRRRRRTPRRRAPRPSRWRRSPRRRRRAALRPALVRRHHRRASLDAWGREHRACACAPGAPTPSRARVDHGAEATLKPALREDRRGRRPLRRRSARPRPLTSSANRSSPSSARARATPSCHCRRLFSTARVSKMPTTVATSAARSVGQQVAGHGEQLPAAGEVAGAGQLLEDLGDRRRGDRAGRRSGRARSRPGRCTSATRSGVNRSRTGAITAVASSSSWRAWIGSRSSSTSASTHSDEATAVGWPCARHISTASRARPSRSVEAGVVPRQHARPRARTRTRPGTPCALRRRPPPRRTRPPRRLDPASARMSASTTRTPSGTGSAHSAASRSASAIWANPAREIAAQVALHRDDPDQRDGDRQPAGTGRRRTASAPTPHPRSRASSS